MSVSPRISLIGAGIMSATLAMLLKQLMPDAQITIFERLDRVGAESSDAWNNAGTGHSAFCELNYTPYNPIDGSVDITKALKISESFEISKQFWAYLMEQGNLVTQSPFINDIDHLSIVWGEENRDFLKARYQALSSFQIFEDMVYTEDHQRIAQWVPLMMQGRNPNEILSSTQMAIGTDVNFGAITRAMITALEKMDGVELLLGHEVSDLSPIDNGWLLDVDDLHSGNEKTIASEFVFIGAGGGTLKLLEKSDIPEGEGYGGFPVSGQFLICNNPEIVNRHEAKVYGKAAQGSPPMSVPHLDTRMLDGERSLLFGPYAGFSTKFLKNGSYLDLPLSIEMHNVWPLLAAGVHNINLTKYLVKQVTQSPEERFEFLKIFYPEANISDWNLITAGQRVQIIKKDIKEGGVLKFGTEIIVSKDGSLAALLGASPGASTSVSIMGDVINQCFPEMSKSTQWQNKLKEMIPSYGESLIENGDLCRQVRDTTSNILNLN